MPIGEAHRQPQEPRAPGDTGGSFKNPGAEGTAPPLPGKVLSPTRMLRDRIGGVYAAGRRVVSPHRIAAGEGRAASVVSPNRTAASGGGVPADANENQNNYRAAEKKPKASEFPGETKAERRAARDAWIAAQQAQAPEGVMVWVQKGEGGTSDGGSERRNPAKGSEGGSETKEREALDPVKDAEYIKGEKARSVAAKILKDNQMGEDADAVALTEYGEAVAPKIDDIQVYFKEKIDGDPEHGIEGKSEDEVLDMVKRLAGDTSNLGLLDNQLNATTDITKENMGEALVLAASADPEGFKQRMEEMGIKGIDSVVAQSALEAGTADGMYSLHEEYLLSIGDEEGAAIARNNRMDEGRLDMSPEAVAEREEQRQIAEEEDQRLADEAREVTKKILVNTGKDRDASLAGHEDKVSREGVKVKERLDAIEHTLLVQSIGDLDSGLDAVQQAYELLGGRYADFGNGPELITKDNMAQAVLLAASNDREEFARRAENLAGASADIAKTALEATSGADMTAYKDDMAASILNYGRTKDITSGRVEGTVEPVVVPTLDGPKVVDIAVKSDDVAGDGTAPVGWDSASQKTAYTKVFGDGTDAPAFPDSLGSDIPTFPDSQAGIKVGTGSPNGQSNIPTFSDSTDSVAINAGSSETTDAPTFSDATNPDAVPVYSDAESEGVTLNTGNTASGNTSGQTPEDQAFVTPDGIEVIMPGSEPVSVDSGEPKQPGDAPRDHVPGSTETQYATDGTTAAFLDEATQTATVMSGDRVGTFVPPANDEKSEDTHVYDGDRGNDGANGTGPMVIDATPVSGDSFRAGEEVSAPATNMNSEVPAPAMMGDVFNGSGDASRAAAEEARAEEGDFLTTTGGGPGGFVVEGHVGEGLAEASNSEKGGDDALNGDDGGAGDDDGAGAAAGE